MLRDERSIILAARLVASRRKRGRGTQAALLADRASFERTPVRSLLATSREVHRPSTVANRGHVSSSPSTKPVATIPGGGTVCTTTSAFQDCKQPSKNRGNQTVANVWSRFSLSLFLPSLPSPSPPLLRFFFLLRGSSRCAQVRASILSRSAFLRVRARGRRNSKRKSSRRREDKFLSVMREW